MKQMEGLFYSVQDKKLFFIPNYYTHGTGTLENLRKNLSDGESVLRQFVATGEIYCDEIKQSRRYKHMWYFSVDCETAPKEAFVIGEIDEKEEQEVREAGLSEETIKNRRWTMWKWIHD